MLFLMLILAIALICAMVFCYKLRSKLRARRGNDVSLNDNQPAESVGTEHQLDFFHQEPPPVYTISKTLDHGNSIQKNKELYELPPSYYEAIVCSPSTNAAGQGSLIR